MSIKLDIPGGESLEIDTLILDLNGTITINGELITGVSDCVAEIRKLGVQILLFSGDTRGNANNMAEQVGADLVQCGSAREKAEAAQNLVPEKCATIGNGLIDSTLFETVAISILVIQAEGAHMKTLERADIVCVNVLDALRLFTNHKSLIATLRS